MDSLNKLSACFKLLCTGQASSPPSQEAVKAMDFIRDTLENLESHKDLVFGLQRFQKQARLSDVTIKVGGKLFHAHRCVLAAVSPYFEAMFASGYQESSKKEIEIKDIDDKVFELLLNCVYFGTMDLSLDNAADTIFAAIYLQLSCAQAACERFLLKAIEEETLSPKEALLLLVVAEDNGITELLEKCYEYLIKTDNFLKVLVTRSFLEKAPSKLIDRFLRRVDIPPETNETQLFQCIVAWLKHDWKNRKDHAADFLQKIRLGLILNEKVKEIMDGEILELPECKELLDGCMKNCEVFANECEVARLPESFLPRNFIRTLISICGPDQHVRFFNRDTHSWDILNEFPEIPCELPSTSDPDLPPQLLSYHAALVVNGDIYVAGGEVEEKSSDDDDRFFKFDSKTYTWQKLPSMSDGRSCFSLVHLNNFIYAVGGVGPDGWIGYAERFNITDQVWDRTYTLPDTFIHTSAVVFNGKLLVYGLKDFGDSQHNNIGRNNIYALLAFDPMTQKWSKLLEEQMVSPYGMPNTYSVLVVHQNVCFRVWYKEIYMCAGEMPCVNAIDIGMLRNGVIRARIGYEVGNQDTFRARPMKDGCAFHINGRVYAKVSQYVHDTGMYMNDKSKLDVEGWDYWTCQNPGVVEFTLDLSKVTKAKQK